MRRASLVWRKYAPEVQIIRTPIPASRFYGHGFDSSIELRQAQGILHEYIGVVYYWLKGAI